jgi:hypothetical protein
VVELPKINELIFLVYFSGDPGRTRSVWGLSSVSKALHSAFSVAARDAR